MCGNPTAVRAALAIAAVCASARGVAQTDWRELTDTMCVARTGAAAAYDPLRRCTVAFGGIDSTTTSIARTETWDGRRWITPTLTVEPTARVSHAMVFDLTRGRTLLFGGRLNGAPLGDAWEWDGSSWLPLLSVGPSPREGAVMAHDLGRGRTLLFGGRANAAEFSDTWEWDGSSWHQLQPQHSPPPLGTVVSMSMVYDLYRSRCVLCRFSYLPFSPTGPVANPAEVWEWNGIDWLHATPASSPSYRSGAAMAFDLAMGRTVLFGGNALPSTPLNEMWVWDGSAWQQINPATGPSPPRRQGAGIAYDMMRARLVLFGGQDYSMLADTWEWDGATWVPRSIHLPPPRSRHAAAFDSARSAGVLFGGLDAANGAINDTWEWRDGDWQRTAPRTRPSVRSWPGMAFDAARQRTVLFGGLLPLGNNTVNDTWEWNGLDWLQRLPTISPPARADAAMTYDAARQRIVLFGGRSPSTVTVFQDTWIFDGTTWTPLAPQHTPSARYAAALAFDAARQRGVLFGGFDGQSTAGDTWEWDGTDWIARSPVTNPPARSSAVLVFDTTRARAVLSLGVDSSVTALDDTWEWDGIDWHARNATLRPTSRSQAAAFFDAAENRTIVFGGSNALGQRLAETWSYGPVQPASIAPFGAGCAGSAGTPLLRADGGTLPWLGDTLALAVEATLANAPVLLAIGFSNTTFGGTSLPASLDAIGMTGCTLLVSIDEQRLAFATGARADFALAVPTTTALTGLQFFAQAAVADAAANAAGIVASNGLEGRIGSK